MTTTELIEKAKRLTCLKELFVIDVLRALGTINIQHRKKYDYGVPDIQTDEYIYEVKRDIYDLNRIESYVRIMYYEKYGKPVRMVVFSNIKHNKSKRPFKLKYDINKVLYVDDMIKQLPVELQEEFLCRKQQLDISN